MSLSAPFIRRPVATTLIMIAITLTGLVAYPLLPVASLPQIDSPTLQVSATLPGGSPATIAATVAAPLERQFAQIPGLAQMTSTSTLNTTTIVLQFELERNIDAAALDVQSAINAASGVLPKDLPFPPQFKKVNPGDSPIMTLGVYSTLLPLPVVDDYADNIIAQQVTRMPGVGQVTLQGERKPAVRVQIDPSKLTALGLDLEDIRNVIGQITVNRPKGNLNGKDRNYIVYANDQLTGAGQWGETIVAYRNGGPIRLRDIGRVVDGAEYDKQGAWPNGHPGIGMFIYKVPGSNVVATVDRIKAELPRIVASLPPAIKVELLTDRTQTIRASVDDVQFTLLLSIALVVMVIFVFLRNVWATVIPSIAVPLSLLGTFALMYLAGYSLDNLSLMALTIAVGFVVDDAIVMLENVYRYIEEGYTPMEASFKGAREIGFTIMSISISLVAVFIPVLLMSGIIGRLLREFAITVSMAILVSGIVSLTLTPMMCARVLRDERHVRHGRLYLLSEKAFDWLLEQYRRGLDFVLDHQGLTLASFGLTLAATVVLFMWMPKGFFPQQDTGYLLGLTEGSQDISFDAMVKHQLELTQLLLDDPDIASVTSGMGGGTQNNGRVFAMLKPKGVRKASADQIVGRLRQKMKALEGATLFLQVPQDVNLGGRLARTQYQYTLQDIDLDELNEWAPRVMDAFASLPQLKDLATDQQTGAATLDLVIDREAAARYGIQPALIDDTIYDAFGARQITQYFTQLNVYHVILEILPELQSDVNVLDKIYIKSPATGLQVPLSAFTKHNANSLSLLSVNHQGQFPSVTLSFNLQPGVALGDAIAAIKAKEASLMFPPGLSSSFQGNAQAFERSLKSAPVLILAALVSVYIILGILYESFIHPLTILSTLPSAGVGAFLFLMLFHMDLSIIGLIGILLLIGIVKKNGIMIVDFALDAQRRQFVAPREAIRQACLLRFRPIMMTTMAALLGGLPLIVGTGTGAELRQPLGVAMVGGLAVSRLLTLFSTPVIYLAFERLRRPRRKKQAMPELALPVRLEAAE